MKKNIEILYKRVEKHFADSDRTLLTIVWKSIHQRSMTEYPRWNALTTRCYPPTGDSQVLLEFSSQEFAEFFAECHR